MRLCTFQHEWVNEGPFAISLRLAKKSSTHISWYMDNQVYIKPFPLKGITKLIRFWKWTHAWNYIFYLVTVFLYSHSINNISHAKYILNIKIYLSSSNLHTKLLKEWKFCSLQTSLKLIERDNNNMVNLLKMFHLVMLLFFRYFFTNVIYPKIKDMTER